MQYGRILAGIGAAALLLSAAAMAAPEGQAIVLTRPAASAAEAVEAVADAVRRGDAQGAVKLAALALDRRDLSGRDRAHTLLNRGLAFEQTGAREPALADFSEALRSGLLAPEERARALFDRGVVLDELGRTLGAIADYGAAIDLSPQFPAALNNRGNAYRRLGRLAEARRDYEASLAAGNTAPQYPEYGLGQIAEAQGNPLAAQDHYKKALDAAPHYALAAQRLAALDRTLTQAAFVLHPPPAADPVKLKPPREAQPARVAAAAPASHARVTPASYGIVDSIPELRPAILGSFASLKHAQIQLGAYRAEADAAEGWNALVVRAKGLLGGLTPRIVAVDIPERGRYWRLRAGPLGRGGADALCGRLKARGLACLPVRD